ncbi:MAG: ABC transporter substrate-binding protein, partial [Firmicutes bacterium]|nr:ABC transporter substrate-binding protein [Bacillota bacterium]
MNKKYNLFMLVILGLTALLVLSQPQQEWETGADHEISTLPAPERLIVTQPDDVGSLDPALATDPGSLRVIANIYEGLVRFKPGTVQVEPCLATGWEVSTDAKVWTFHLRHDVLFQDGTPLSAQLVEKSVKRQTEAQKNQTGYADFVYAPVQKIEVLDHYTIRFDLKYPFAPFINNLAVPMSAPVMGPSAVDQAPDGVAAPSGTGPYIPVQKIKGGILLRANPHYWSTAPVMKEIVFLTVKDPAAATQMLLQGQSDVALELNFDEAARARAQGFPVYSATGLDICYLGFYTDRSPFDRVGLRQAVA